MFVYSIKLNGEKLLIETNKATLTGKEIIKEAVNKKIINEADIENCEKPKYEPLEDLKSKEIYEMK